MSLLLHPASGSPDPLYGRKLIKRDAFQTALLLHPVACLRACPAQPAARKWAARMSRFQPAGPLALTPGSGRWELLLDFGTELEGELELVISGGRCRLYAGFGESIPEAEALGMPTSHPQQTVEWVVPSARARHRFASRGFRFVRLQAHDVLGRMALESVVVHAVFGFREQKGDLRCSNPGFQRVWQTSAYTVRLCANENMYWDGIKRDRVGWFGDARIIQETADAVFHDPRPAQAMLSKQLPVDSWVTGIPGYSFDAAAMLRQQILSHGLATPGARDAYRQIRAMLEWAARTQCNRQGLITRDPAQEYFSTVCFFDWSPMPLGGRFEDLSPLQCQHLEALRIATQLAVWLGEQDDALRWTRRADRLAKVIRRRFWVPGLGLHHTLRRSVPEWLPMFNAILDPQRRYLDRYHKKADCGPSGPSRHSMAMAWRAGLLDTPACRKLALDLFRSRRLPALQTPYFLYYEQDARAWCGDHAGAVKTMRDYVAAQLEENDSATVWEWYVPGESALERLALGDWPKSLCHGWGSGLVPLAQRHLLGIRPVGPGYRSIVLAPAALVAMDIEATVPTPFGPISASKSRRGGWTFRVPKEIEICNNVKSDGVSVLRHGSGCG
ncbi:MAG: hypothetical protein WCL16_07170 [bacterium]